MNNYQTKSSYPEEDFEWILNYLAEALKVCHSKEIEMFMDKAFDRQFEWSKAALNMTERRSNWLFMEFIILR